MDELLSSIDSAELTEWLAYLQLEAERDQPNEDDAWRKAFNAYG